MTRILIIDDEFQNVELTRTYLQLFDIDTLEAYSGQGGFRYAQAYQPDLIFTDLRMPIETWDGYETIFHLKTHHDTHHIPVVALTATGDIEQAKQAGCDDVLMRPFCNNQLKQILEQYIDVA